MRCSTSIILSVFFLYSTAEAKIPQSLLDQKKAVVSVHVKDRSGDDIAREAGVVVDESGIVVSSCRMIRTWLSAIDNELVISTEKGAVPIHRLLSYNLQFDVAVFKVDAEGFRSARLSSDSIGAYIKRHVERYKKTAKATPHDRPLPDIVNSYAPESNKFRQPDHVDMPAIAPPDTRKSRFQQGLAYAKEKRYAEAVEEFNAEINKNPQHGDAYLNLGLALYSMNRYTEAIDAYKKALALGPETKSLYNKIGTIYLILADYQAALDSFRNALRLDNNDPATHFNIALTYILRGDKNTAWETYVTLKKIDGGFARKLLELLD